LKPVLIGIGIALAAYFFPITTAIILAAAALSKLGSYLKQKSFSNGVIPGGMGNISMSVNGQVSTVSATTKNTVAITKLTAAQIAQTKLDKAKAMFDLQRIGISAALKGNITGDARNRLMAMQAIENGNAADAAKYSGKINPNAGTSITVNVTPQNLIGTQQDLIDQIKTSLQVANRRAYGSTYATI
jgi:hypothetical protein